jgi:tetratricopeptide (TPR) repeat protein
LASDWVYLYRGKEKASGLKDYVGAIADFDQAIRLNPDSGQAYYHRASAKTKIGDGRGALADLFQAAPLFKKAGEDNLYSRAQADIERLRPIGGGTLIRVVEEEPPEAPNNSSTPPPGATGNPATGSTVTPAVPGATGLQSPVNGAQPIPLKPDALKGPQSR